MKKDAGEAVRAVAQRACESRGFELVDVELKRQPTGLVVRLFADKPGGIGLEDLQSLSEEVSAILDVEDAIAAAFTLEVSSPGLDRPLKTEADYARFVGKLAKLASYEPIDGRRHWLGRIEGCEGGFVALRLEKEGGQVVRVPFAKLSHGRLEVEFPTRQGKSAAAPEPIDHQPRN